MIETLKLSAKKFLPIVFHNLKILVWTLTGLFVVTKFIHKPKFSGLVKSLTFFLVALSFFFVHPRIGAQTQVIDTVITGSETQETMKITDEIVSAHVPVYQAPLHGYISTYFSPWHQGIDIPAPNGAPVKALSNGEVTFAGWSALGYGNLVTIRHEGGVEALYAHLSAVNVHVGQKVTDKTTIGLVGATGVATGAHLHLETHFYGQAVNPLEYVSIEKLLGKVR